jgi:septal ring factor EnvC (AmiA/AmiB activator)
MVVVGVAAAGLLSVLPATSQAEPRPTLRQVQAQVDALNERVDAANERYVDAKIALAAAGRRAAVAQGRVAAAQKQLDAVKRQMSRVAAEAYRTGGTDQFVSLMSTSSPQTFLDRSSSLDRIAAGQSAQMAAAATARHRLATVQAQAAQEKAAQTAITKTMKAQKAEIEKAVAEQQRILSVL